MNFFDANIINIIIIIIYIISTIIIITSGYSDWIAVIDLRFLLVFLGFPLEF